MRRGIPLALFAVLLSSSAAYAEVSAGKPSEEIKRAEAPKGEAPKEEEPKGEAPQGSLSASAERPVMPDRPVSVPRASTLSLGVVSLSEPPQPSFSTLGGPSHTPHQTKVVVVRYYDDLTLAAGVIYGGAGVFLGKSTPSGKRRVEARLAVVPSGASVTVKTALSLRF